MEHPGLQALEQLAAGRGSSDLKSHVERCPSCREELERVRANGEMLARLAASGTASDASEDTPSAEPQPFPGYRVGGEVHRGGQGIVYKAVQLATSRTVAIKVLVDGVFASATKRERFEREIELVSALRHPNIVTVHDSGVAPDGRGFLVMEYVRGAALHQHVERNRPERRELVRLCAVISSAVGYAHQRGVIHRDLKPSNVLVDSEGEPRVVDFGLARATAPSSAERTQSGEFLGTLAFASPEQVRGDPELVDVRTDVYSLGVLYYRLLTGHSPYGDTSSVAQLVHGITHVAPVGSTGDGELDAVLRKAMEKEREHRYQSAGELARDLDNVLTGRPVDARRDSPGYVLRKLLWRHRYVASAATLAVLLMAVAALVSLSGWRAAADEASTARIEAAKARELSDFLGGLFSSVNPWISRGPQVRVRELLDDASERLRDAPLAEPEVERELRALIGRSYLSLGHPELARPHLEAAFAMVSGAQDASVRVPVVTQYGRCMVLLGELDRAETLLLRADREIVGTELESTGRGAIWSQLLQIAQARGDFEAAQRIFAGAEDLMVAAGDTRSRTLLLANRAFHLTDRGELDAAAELIARAEDVLAATGGEGGASHAWLLRSKARLAARRNQHARAAELSDRSLDLLAPSVGDDHPLVLDLVCQAAWNRVQAGEALAPEVSARIRAARAKAPVGPNETLGMLWNMFGLLSEHWGEFEEAELCYQRSLECYEAMPGSFATATPVIRSNLSWIHHELGELEAAEEEGWRALEGFEAVRAILPIALVRCVANQTWILYRLGKLDEAERVAELGWEVAEELLSEGGVARAEALSTLGLVDLQRGRFGQAEERLRAALEVFDGANDPLDLSRIYALHRLAITLIRRGGRVDEAEALFLEIAELYLRAPGMTASNAAEALNEAARLQKYSARGDEALATCLRAVALCREAGPSAATVSVASLLLAAQIRREAGDPAEEEALLREAVSVARLHLAPADEARQVPLVALAEVLEREQREEEALAVREELLECLLEARGPDDTRTRAATRELLLRYEDLGLEERAGRLRGRVDALRE